LLAKHQIFARVTLQVAQETLLSRRWYLQLGAACFYISYTCRSSVELHLEWLDNKLKSIMVMLEDVMPIGSDHGCACKASGLS
jgi:hypothetical protein